MRRRGDLGAAYLCTYQFVDAALDAAYLLNHLYAPFYKWKMKGTEEFQTMTDLKEQLLELMELRPDPEIAGTDKAQTVIESICQEMVQELNRQGLSDSREAFLEIQKEELMRRCR
jgi:hypothetical protein